MPAPIPQFPIEGQEEGNVFITTDLPDPEVERKHIASRRLFFVMLGVVIILIGFIVWEVVEIALGGRP